MRAISVTLYANDGLGSVFTAQPVTGKIAKLGKLSWALDEEYTKLSPGSLTVQVWDEDGAIWAWLDTQISTTVRSRSQLLPPWVLLDVGGVRRFLGVLDIPSLRRDLKSRTIDLSAQDWSVMLRDATLEGAAWERAYPRTVGPRGFAGPFQVYSANPVWWGPDTLLVDARTSGLDIQEGDTIRHQATGTGFKLGTIEDSRLRSNPVTRWTFIMFKLPGFTGEGHPSPWTFVRDTALDSLPDQHYYLAQAALVPTDEAPVFALPLDTVDQLTPGDVLTTISGGEIKVNDIDSERKEVISLEPIAADIANGQKVYLSSESRETIIFEDALALLRKAAMPYSIDASRFVTPTLTRPILAWLPLRIDGRDLSGARDVEPTPGTMRVWGSGSTSWTGTPETGWALSGAASRTVPWTSQLAAAPSALMPDEMPALAPRVGYRHRVYYEWKYARPVLLNAAWEPVTPDYTPDVLPATILCHDYNRLRRLTITGGTVLEQRWSGSAWSTGTSTAWPATGWTPAVAVPMPGVVATTGPVSPQGQAILAVCTNGTAWELQLAFAGATVRLALDGALAGAQLRTTPWGAYLLGPGGYGRVTYAAGALSLAWAPVRGAGQAVLLPSTFAAIDDGSVWCMAQFTQLDTKGKAQTEIHLLQLSTTPDISGATSPILSSEMISRGAPRQAVAVKDPSAPRLIGLLGGRVFQVAAKLPATIERVRAYGMTGSELIEHVCQALCAVAVPLPSGTLQIISRTAGASVGLTVDQTKVTQQRVNQYFFSAVRVGGQNDTFADAFGAWAGGRALEISSHPMLWTEGGCYGLASAYAQFHGVPRREESQAWFFEDPDAAGPWEALQPWTTLTINGGPTAWILTALEYDVVTGDATAKLLEATS